VPTEPLPPHPAGNANPAEAEAALPQASVSSTATRPKRHHAKRLLGVLAVVVVLYAVTAYLIVPQLWKRYAGRHPSLEDIPGVTYTGSGIPADPLNVALVGTEEQVMQIMVAAKWFPADPLTLRSCLRIADASVLKRPYDDAPVSNEYLFDRKQDFAFEQPVGPDPRKRHHVRFWKTDTIDDSRPVWVGSAVFDERVELRRTTGQFTHKTAPDVDAERDYLFADLKKTGELADVEIIRGFHKVLEGRNGEGNIWRTDGDLYLGVIKPVGSR
jgi:hypothetical protein